MARSRSPPSTAHHWYPAIAAVERDTACAEIEHLARGKAPSKAWEVSTARTKGAAGERSVRSPEGVERLLHVARHLNGLERVTVLAQALEGSETEAAIPADSRGFNGQTTMAFAAAHGLDDVVQLLLRYDADVNLANSRGWTPLMLACQRNHLPTVSVLLRADSQMDLGLANRDGESALTVALAAGHIEVCTALVQAGAVLPTMLGTGSALEAREKMLDLARKGLHLSASSGATAVVRECLRVLESQDWDRQNPPGSALAKPTTSAAVEDTNENEAMLFARTGKRKEKFLWPGHRLAKGMERRRNDLRARGEEMLREAAGRQRRLPCGTIVLLAPGHESAGNGALQGDETGTVVKVTNDDTRCRVKGPSGRHCWYAVEELLSWKEKKALEAAMAPESADPGGQRVDPGVPNKLTGVDNGDFSRPQWGVAEIIRRNQSVTAGFQVAEEERLYVQEMRRQQAARQQKELWEKHRQRRMHKKGSHAQKVLQEAFARGGGKTPEGTELSDIVAACRIKEAEVVEWFSYSRKQQKERKAGLRWGGSGGTLMGQGSDDDDMLKRIDEAERELRRKQLEKMKQQEIREQVHADWVAKWGGEMPSATERKRLGGEDNEPPLEDPNDGTEEDQAVEAQRAWAEQTAAKETTAARALLARRKRQQDLDATLGQPREDESGLRLSRSMLSRRNAVTAVNIGGSGSDTGNASSSLDNLTKCLRVARSYEPHRFQEVLQAQLGESSSKSTRKMLRTAQRSRAKQAARQGKTRWQCAHYGFPTDPCDWSVETVCRWLRRLGLGNANHKIRGRHIDGTQLTHMHVDTFCKLIGSADHAGDVNKDIDGAFGEWSSSDGAVKKAAARAISFLQSGFSEERLRKRIAAELQLDNDDFYSAFHLSIMRQDEEALERYIQQGQDVNGKTALGRSPLLLAVATGNLKIVELLREAGAYDPHIPASSGGIEKQQRRSDDINGEVGAVASSGSWTDADSNSSSVASSQTESDEAD